MATGFRERDFEEHIVNYLTQEIEPDYSEYVEKDNSVYNKEWCIMDIPEQADPSTGTQKICNYILTF